jgi:hypothetical protein
MKKSINQQIQEPQQTSSSLNTKRSVSRHILNEKLKEKDQQKT